MTDDRALQVWNEARAAALASGVYPADMVNSMLLSRCVALLERLVDASTRSQEQKTPEMDTEPIRSFPGQRFAGAPNGK